MIDLTNWWVSSKMTTRAPVGVGNMYVVSEQCLKATKGTIKKK